MSQRDHTAVHPYTQPGPGQLQVGVPGTSLSLGRGGEGGLVLKSRQEPEQSLLRDFTASSLQFREGCETEAAIQAMLFGLERLITAE